MIESNRQDISEEATFTLRAKARAKASHTKGAGQEKLPGRGTCQGTEVEGV